MDGNLFVTTNAKGSHGVSGLRVDGRLTGQLLEHLRGTSQSVTRFTHANVQAEFANSHLSHGVLSLVLRDDGARLLCSGLGGRGGGLFTLKSGEKRCNLDGGDFEEDEVNNNLVKG